ncbi:MAG: hypothetical protein K1X81_06670 [Bacteroidia bacterium]|nr:hypothetical protein [Bacteroidia bacterium]
MNWLKYFLCCLLLFSLNRVGAHSLPDSLIRWAWYIDLGGQGIHPSLNFDKILKPSQKVRFGFNFGINFPVIPTLKASGLNVSAFALFGKKSHYFEAGAGLGGNYFITNRTMYAESYIVPSSAGKDSLVFHRFYSEENRILTYGFIKAGYRFYDEKSNLFLRVYAMPVIGIQNILFYPGSHFGRNAQVREHNAPYYTTRIGAWGGFSIGAYFIPKKYRKSS